MAKVLLFVFAIVAFSLLSESFGYKSAPAPKPKPDPEPKPKPEPKCPKNEEYLDCGRPCQTVCTTLGKKCTIVNIKCPSACYCKAGFARITPEGPCVPQDKCPKKACPKNEVWLECGQASACQTWCDELNVGCYIKPSSCPEGCYCKKGYARDRKTKNCIKIKECPKKKDE